MRVTLAYPIDGIGDPDETVEVDETTGRRLIADGFARPSVEDAEPRHKARSHKARSPRKPPADGTPPEHEGGQ